MDTVKTVQCEAKMDILQYYKKLHPIPAHFRVYPIKQLIRCTHVIRAYESDLIFVLFCVPTTTNKLNRRSPEEHGKMIDREPITEFSIYLCCQIRKSYYQLIILLRL